MGLQHKNFLAFVACRFAAAEQHCTYRRNHFCLYSHFTYFVPCPFVGYWLRVEIAMAILVDFWEAIGLAWEVEVVGMWAFRLAVVVLGWRRGLIVLGVCLNNRLVFNYKYFSVVLKLFIMCLEQLFINFAKGSSWASHCETEIQFLFRSQIFSSFSMLLELPHTFFLKLNLHFLTLINRINKFTKNLSVESDLIRIIFGFIENSFSIGLCIFGIFFIFFFLC